MQCMPKLIHQVLNEISAVNAVHLREGFPDNCDFNNYI